MKKFTLLTASALAVSSMAMGGSFQLNLQGLRQGAMGGSGTALPWDASTIFYNPGGLARLNGIQAYAGMYLVSPRVRFAEPTGNYFSDAKNQTSTPFAVYVGGRVTKDSRLGFGLGIYTPFGSSIDWKEGWSGRYITQSISLQSFFFQPTVSYEINDVLSVGAGFVYAMGNVDIEKALPVADANGDGRATLSGKAQGFGFNVGVQIKASEKVQFGLTYRSGVNMKVKDGSANFFVPQSLTGNFANTNFDTELPLPGILTFGAGIKASKRLTLQADLVFAGWRSYDSLSFDFANNDGAVQDTHDPRLYRNTFAVRGGAHYKVCDEFAVMLGAAYDPTPTRNNLVSPDAVDANRINITGGLTYNPIPQLTIMGTFYYTITPKRDVSYEPANFNGSYQIKSLAPGLAVSYNF